jgi:hypothetical protein
MVKPLGLELDPAALLLGLRKRLLDDDVFVCRHGLGDHPGMEVRGRHDEHAVEVKSKHLVVREENEDLRELQRVLLDDRLQQLGNFLADGTQESQLFQDPDSVGASVAAGADDSEDLARCLPSP